MADNILEALLGSRSKARVIRFFVLNHRSEFSFSDVRSKNLLQQGETRKELNSLEKIEFLKSRKVKGKKHYKMNTGFMLFNETRNLVLKSNVFPQCKTLKKMSEIGETKLVLATGIFLNYPKSRIDLLIVSDKINKTKMRKIIEHLEAEVGKEIKYMLIGNDELLYRLDMLDRLLIDLFKGPHDIIFSRIPKLGKMIANFRKQK